MGGVRASVCLSVMCLKRVYHTQRADYLIFICQFFFLFGFFLHGTWKELAIWHYRFHYSSSSTISVGRRREWYLVIYMHGEAFHSPLFFLFFFLNQASFFFTTLYFTPFYKYIVVGLSERVRASGSEPIQRNVLLV